MRRSDRVDDRRVGDADVDLVEVGKGIDGQVQGVIAARDPIEGGDLEAVTPKPRRDRRADPARGSGDERPPHSPVSCVPARPASVFS